MQEMKRIKQKERGITLIALVITIIVLLILAAVSIATLTGENGILTKANKAAEAQKKAEVEEKVKVEVLGSYDDDGKFQMETLKENLEKHLGVTSITDNADGSISFVLDGYDVTVKTDGTVEVGDKGEEEKEQAPPQLQESDIHIEYDKTDWTPGPVTVTITVKKEELKSYRLEYSTNRNPEWQEYTNSFEVEDNNTEIYARLVNSIGEGEKYTAGKITIIDKEAPQTVTISKGEQTTKGVTINVEATDAPENADNTSGSSGIKKYYFSSDGGNSWLPEGGKEQEGGQISYEVSTQGLTEGTHTIKVKAEDKAKNSKESDNTIQVEIKSNYLGCYVDLDENIGNGPEGIIYADLAESKEGDWNKEDEDTAGYAYTKETKELKAYVIGNKVQSANFNNQEREILSLKNGTSGASRFYVMALEDISKDTYYWYQNAIGLDNLVSGSSNDFGQGKQKTTDMINRWTEDKYGAKNTEQDLWGVIQKREIKNKYGKDWFVPSKSELSAFADMLVTIFKVNNSSLYSEYGLQDYYLSSSQYYAFVSWYADFSAGIMDKYKCAYEKFGYVRMSTMF